MAAEAQSFIVTVNPGDIECSTKTIRAALAQGFTVIGCASITAADITVEEA
jgi:hypothetical protein